MINGDLITSLRVEEMPNSTGAMGALEPSHCGRLRSVAIRCATTEERGKIMRSPEKPYRGGFQSD